jgi:hypothetical protein
MAFLLYSVGTVSGIWLASEWWETGLAKPLREPVFSPNGCYRVERFKPFWVLPDMFHRRSHPDEDRPPNWLPRWGNPGFYRLYDQRNGAFLGQSKIYDLESTSGPLLWGTKSFPEVSAGLIPIGPNVPDCIGDRPSKAKVNQ